MMAPGRRDPEQTTQDAMFPFHPMTIPQVPMMLLHFMDRFAQFFFKDRITGFGCTPWREKRRLHLWVR